MALYQSDGLRISTYANGDTPYIKDGYWWIGNKNLNIKAEGVDGKDGQDGIDGTSASPVYAIELSNDNATIGTDADGKSWNADLLKLVSTINVSVSEGETDITNNCDFDWTSNGCTLVEDDVEGVTQTCKWLTNISADSASVTIFVTQINPLKTIGFKTFTITKQKQGVQGIPGPKGNDGTGVAVKASAEDCTEIGDAYIDSDGNLLILTVLPDTFTNGGQIKGPPGTSSYLHVAYADDASGTNMEQDPSGKAYIGTYVDEEQKDSQDPSDYKWTKWEGDAAVTYVLSVSPNSWNISDSASIAPVLSVTKYVGNTVSAAPSGEYLIKGIKNNTEYNWPNSTQWPDNKISASTTFKLYIKDENGNFTIQADSETITANRNGADGRGILSTTVTHAKTSTLVDDPSNIPEYSQSNPDGWASRLPTVGENEYLWTRTIIDYTTGKDTVTYSYMYQGKTVKGDSITVKSILYQIGDTSTTPPTGTWKALSEVGTVPTQKYLWSKTTFSDDTFVYGTSYQSKDGVTAKDFNITASSYALLKDIDGNYKNTIELSAHLLNITGTPDWYKGTTKVASGNTYTVTTPGTYTAKIGTTWEDSVIIGEVADGAIGPDGKPAIAIMLTNPTMTFHNSTTNEFEYCEVIVYEGGEKLTQAASGDGTFSIAEKTDAQNKASIVNGKIKISDPTSDGSATFTITVRPKSKTATTTQDYTIYWKVVSNGEPGPAVEVRYIYYLSNSIPQRPTNKDQIPNGWTTMPSGVSSENLIEWYCSQRIETTSTSTTFGDWTEPKQYANYNQNVEVTNIFNALTEDSTKFGVFGNNNGQCYINANYIKTGALTIAETTNGQVLFEAGFPEGNQQGRVSIAKWQITSDGIVSPDGTFGLWNNNTNKTATSLVDNGQSAIRMSAGAQLITTTERWLERDVPYVEDSSAKPINITLEYPCYEIVNIVPYDDDFYIERVEIDSTNKKKIKLYYFYMQEGMDVDFQITYRREDYTFKFLEDGSIYASAMKIEGKADILSSGSLAGWDYDQQGIWTDNFSAGTGIGLWSTTNHANIAIHAGATTSNIGSAPFRVYHDGTVCSSGAREGSLCDIKMKNGELFISGTSTELKLSGSQYIATGADGIYQDEGDLKMLSLPWCSYYYYKRAGDTSYTQIGGLTSTGSGYGSPNYAAANNRLTMVGTWYAAGNLVAAAEASTSSDMNKKYAIENLPDIYSTLFDNLQPVIYKYNDGSSGRYHTGFIAQPTLEAVEKAGLTSQDFAGVVIENRGEENEQWYLRYGEFVALNTNEIQKLKPRMTAAEEEISQLKNKISLLETELENLKKDQNSDIINIENNKEVINNDSKNV